MVSVTILGSVFLPVEAFEPYAEALGQRGFDVTLVVPRTSESAAAVLEDYVARTRTGSSLVAHSNAGNFVPAVAQRTSPASVVFVDAVLPPLTGGRWDVVPPHLAGRLRATATGEVIPRWTRWWNHDDIASLFPSEESFARIDGLCHEVRTSFIDDTVSAEPEWSAALTGAYLRLSDAYIDDLSRAAGEEWPTATFQSGHLGMLRDPYGVAENTAALLEQVRTGA